MTTREYITGRPRHYDTPEQLAEAMAAVFEDKDFDFTIMGLVIGLGFVSRQSFYDYEKEPAFSYVIKRGRALVEKAYEKKLSQKEVTGAIFALKNMGWKDRTEVEQTVTMPQINLIMPEGE